MTLVFESVQSITKFDSLTMHTVSLHTTLHNIEGMAQLIRDRARPAVDWHSYKRLSC